MCENCDVAVVGVGVVGLATAFERLTRGLAVTLIGPRGGSHAGQATRAAEAMLSTFSEIEPHHDEQRVTVETIERLAAHEMYPAWLETISGHAGRRVAAAMGTWVLAPAGKRAWLEPGTRPNNTTPPTSRAFSPLRPRPRRCGCPRRPVSTVRT